MCKYVIVLVWRGVMIRIISEPHMGSEWPIRLPISWKEIHFLPRWILPADAAGSLSLRMALQT